EVEALLKQIALAKQKELRLRVEKKRIRDELGQLQAVGGHYTGTLWSREEQTQKQLVEVRRAKEQLQTQKQAEEEKFAKLSDNLKEQELKFRKRVTSPFQQTAATVVAQRNEGSNQTDNADTLLQVTVPVVADGKHESMSQLLPPGTCSLAVFRFSKN
ncbi:Hypothetical protein PHPALM_11219, partial [Phytophthora palmivora]